MRFVEFPALPIARRFMKEREFRGTNKRNRMRKMRRMRRDERSRRGRRGGPQDSVRNEEWGRAGDVRDDGAFGEVEEAFSGGIPRKVWFLGGAGEIGCWI
jgi:hypothetical protein